MIARGVNETPPSRTDWAIERLRDAILFGDARPGDRLVSTVWSTRLGISQTPLREAFQRLAAEGFVDYDPQRGARVAPLTLRDAWEIYDLRILLEPRAIASSVAAGDEAWRGELADAYELLCARYPGHDAMPPGAVGAHRDFHRVMRSRCDSAWLLRITDTLADQSTRMQFASLRARGGQRAARAEHADLYEAARAGDANRAADLCAAHLCRTLVALRFESSP